jgi:hypothetical protein
MSQAGDMYKIYGIVLNIAVKNTKAKQTESPLLVFRAHASSLSWSALLSITPLRRSTALQPRKPI